MLPIESRKDSCIGSDEASEVDLTGSDETQVVPRKAIPIEQKKYTLNDLEALRKKMKKSDLQPEISMTEESKNGNNVNIDMKTSLFEYMKEMWIGDMKKLDDIKDITPITKAQAETGMNGKADVEYTFEVTFNTKGEENKVKIKCYPTKCCVQIQHMGGPSRPKECLDGQHSPKFFGDKFMIPWA